LKRFHAAALALVGWYLMIPPNHLGQQNNVTVYIADSDAPVKQWSRLASFDTAKECETRRREDFADADRAIDQFATTRHDAKDFALDREMLSQTVLKKSEVCIETTDPQLVK
jgi:hypothetical protein